MSNPKPDVADTYANRKRIPEPYTYTNNDTDASDTAEHDSDLELDLVCGCNFKRWYSPRCHSIFRAGLHLNRFWPHVDTPRFSADMVRDSVFG